MGRIEPPPVFSETSSPTSLRACRQSAGRSPRFVRHRCNLLVKLPHYAATQCVTAEVPFAVSGAQPSWQPGIHQPSRQDGKPPATALAVQQLPRPNEESASAWVAGVPPDVVKHHDQRCHLSGRGLREACTPDADFLRFLVLERFGIPVALQRLLVDGRPVECLTEEPRLPGAADCPAGLGRGELSASRGLESGSSAVELGKEGGKGLEGGDACLEQQYPPFLSLTVLLRLRGGKGGFGANLRAVKGRRKKTTNNLDACRDLSGRRMRHAQAVERVKEWLVKKRQEDELVKRLTDGAEQLSLAENDSEPSVSLDRGYVTQIRSRAVQLTRSVREGVRQDHSRERELEAVESKTRATSVSMKELKSSGSWYLHNNALSDDEGDSEPEAIGEEGREPAVAQPSSTRQPRLLKNRTAASGVGTWTSKCQGSIERPNSVVEQPQPSSSFLSTVSTSGSCRSSSPESASLAREKETTVCSVDGGAASSEGAKKRCLPSPLTAEEQGHIEEEAQKLDVSAFSNVEELEKVDPEVLKAKLRQSGMKCGGRPSERAARLFLLKSKSVENLPPTVLAKKAIIPPKER